ncbi:MAG: ribonuclease H-like domain-containing protein [Nanoarchaeota archaeon]|nr:ribonuclease H-like domain-containing protein [Nanoarchaeota archaeon]
MNIKHCFLHLKGINETTEMELYSQEIYSWDLLVESIVTESIELKFKEQILEGIELSKKALENTNWEFFTSKILSKYHYKLLPFTSKIAYVDIETTGLSKYSNYITTIGIYNGNESRVFVRGIDLEEAYNYLEEFDVLVTFNGKQFDLPFIEHFSNKKFNCIHLDLRFMLKELGLSGGLKRIEHQLGITRDDEVSQVDGFEAVRLWHRYQRGDLKALELLKKYNIEDIENLELLLHYYLKQRNCIELLIK